MKNNKKDVQADIEAMDMIKDEICKNDDTNKKIDEIMLSREFKISLRMTEIENILTGEQDEFLKLIDEFIGLYDELRGLDNDNTRDIAIRCVDKMWSRNLLNKMKLPEFEIQDIIHNEINKSLKIEE